MINNIGSESRARTPKKINREKNNHFSHGYFNMKSTMTFGYLSNLLSGLYKS